MVFRAKGSTTKTPNRSAGGIRIKLAPNALKTEAPYHSDEDKIIRAKMLEADPEPFGQEYVLG